MSHDFYERGEEFIGYSERAAWDCDPDMVFADEAYDLDLDDTDDTGDWQVLVLDRFGDRMVTDDLTPRY